MMEKLYCMLICGGREFDDRPWMVAQVEAALAAARTAGLLLVIVEGGAAGADSMARDVGRERGVAVIECPADWKRFGRSGPNHAGARRNQVMADGLGVARTNGAEVCVVAFPGGRGTADMVRRAHDAGIRVWQPVARPAEQMVVAS